MIDRTCNQLLIIDYAGNNGHAWYVRCCRWRSAAIAVTITIAITIAIAIAIAVAVAVAVAVATITVSGIVITPTAATTATASCSKAYSTSNRDPTKNPGPDSSTFMTTFGCHQRSEIV